MKLWKTIDKYFDENEISEIFRDKNFKPFTTKWYSMDVLSPFQKKLLEGAKNNIGDNFCNFDKAIGVEQWTQDASQRVLPEMHFDKDETLYEKTGKLNFPLCSIVLYLKVENLKGANLLIDSRSTVVPESGKAVYIAPGVLHGVTEFIEGKRISVNLNIWDYDINRS